MASLSKVIDGNVKVDLFPGGRRPARSSCDVVNPEQQYVKLKVASFLSFCKACLKFGQLKDRVRMAWPGKSGHGEEKDLILLEEE